MSISRPVRIGVGVLAALVLLAGFSIWVWSFGAVASEGVSPMRIDVVKSPVLLKRQGEAAFTEITSSADVKVGDQIQTGVDGEAAIAWGDRGITRLDPQTTVTVENAPEDPTAATHVVLKLHLEGGRVWSRLLKLLDQDSAADVRTETVVATVRGTSFGVEASSATTTDVAVTESVVGMSARTSQDATLVKEGFWGRFDDSGKQQQMRGLLPTDTWAQDNIKADADFDEGLRRDISARFAKRLVDAPPFLLNVSESLHLSFEKNETERNTLVIGYMGRRIAEALGSPEKSDKILNKSLPLPWNKISPASRERLLLDIRYALFTQSPRPGFTPNQTLVAALRGLRAELLGQDGKNQGYADALSIDDDIDAFLFSGEQKTSSRREELLNQVEVLGEQHPDDALLNDKLDALNLRLQLTADEPADVVVEEATTTQGEPPNTKNTQPKPTDGTKSKVDEPSAPKATCTLQNVQILAMPSAVQVGAKVVLSLYADSSCGGPTQNLTTVATFTPDTPSLASVNGYLMTAIKAGSVGIVGSVTQDGKQYFAKTYIRISPGAKKPIYVSVTTPASTSLTTGQSATLEAQVTYNDDTKTYITPQCVWSTSDANIAIVQGTKLITTRGTGSVNAICTYTESGTTISGSLGFTVVLDPALQPKTKGGTGHSPTAGFGPF